MAEVVIYSTTVCPYCVKAKGLLHRKGVAYQDINLTLNPEQREIMVERTGGRRTVPQIFIDGQYIGGCDDLYALDADGKLNPLLGFS